MRQILIDIIKCVKFNFIAVVINAVYLLHKMMFLTIFSRYTLFMYTYTHIMYQGKNVIFCSDNLCLIPFVLTFRTLIFTVQWISDNY